MLYLGIDVGNFDTKSMNTTFSSGYEGPFRTKPALSSHYLCLNDSFYTPSVDRLYYMKDKTNDERAIVLTLMSIAQELIQKYSEPDAKPSEIQTKISKVTDIALGVGLPVAHYKSDYIKKLVDYYTSYMGDKITFEYDGFTFSFTMKFCKVYPQGGAAAACRENKLAKEYNTYYVVDIGGYTVDVAQFKNGSPSKDRISLEMGIITLYDRIIDTLQLEFDISVDYDTIESVLKEEKTVLHNDAIELILTMAQKHANNIIDALRQKKIMFDSHPVLFVGGGSILLRHAILSNVLIRKDICYFINDARANAKGYARLIKAEVKQMSATN